MKSTPLWSISINSVWGKYVFCLQTVMSLKPLCGQWYYILTVLNTEMKKKNIYSLTLNEQLKTHATLNIFYCSIRNNWIGHKFHNLETSSPIHTWTNTKWTYIILNTYFLLNDDMKKAKTRNKKILKMLSVMQVDYPS